MEEIKQLTAEHIEAMMEVGDGVIIWNYVDAKLLREVGRYNKDLIEFVELDELRKIDSRVAKLTGVERLPYFGAVITDKGVEFLENEGREIFLAEKTK
ncbi:hypothetical protein NSQ93_22520 [Bacillus sp. FSL W8-0445]|uniref:hypothetical protein n=1 Tax=Bacillus TaxID=1386 RepID=UPI00237D278C|nr:hypothetical protein [Bacillus licheniformis]MDE1407015.1 hypothetical protein [Bacillus licheniformis]